MAGATRLRQQRNAWSSDAVAGKIAPADVTKELFSKYLYTTGIPDPDLLIRTGGEYRVSNFLLYQMAYTEFYFTDILWPDFCEADLLTAIAEYQRRERRFGMTSEQIERRKVTGTVRGRWQNQADRRSRSRGGDE